MGCREPDGTKELGMTTESELREQLVRFARQMITTGLVRGTSGNISTREPGAAEALVTPSGVDDDTMKPDALLLVRVGGRHGRQGFRAAVERRIHGARYVRRRRS